MKNFFLNILQSNPEQPSAADSEHALRLATATLLVEVVHADFAIQESEMMRMRELLGQQFALNREELDVLMEQAQQGADKLVSLQHITRRLNQNFDHAMKLRIVEMMWDLVYADREKHHYEEHLIRQVAELLYLSHGEFIRARHRSEVND